MATERTQAGVERSDGSGTWRLRGGTADGISVRGILDQQLVRSVYQPVVDLSSLATVGYEALSRGPAGTALESPASLLEAAAADGLTYELDWACRSSAVAGALEVGLGDGLALFVNAEPETFGRPAPEDVRLLMAVAGAELQVVVEVTEREIARSPATLLARTSRIRDAGSRLAVDDVGVDARSLALLPFVAPDVVKLDMSVVQRHDLGATARVATAVQAYAERSGALIVAEGIETDEHLATALALGAHLRQGWLFGRPAPLIPLADRPAHGAGFPQVQRRRSALTPFAMLSAVRPVRRGTKDLLLRMSRAIESHAVSDGDAAVIVSTFERAEYFTPATAERYERLADDAALVGALGVGLGETPAKGVRGGSLWRSEPLAGEWDVCAVGPYFASAFAARDLGDSGPDGLRRFDYVLTHDRDLVVEATDALLGRLAPT